jgi:hypothetical protein
MRTRVKNKRCVMFRNGGCTIHDKPYYPAVCRGFPWTDAETGGRYEHDITICGEFLREPALVEIQRGGRGSVAVTAGSDVSEPERQVPASR